MNRITEALAGRVRIISEDTMARPQASAALTVLGNRMEDLPDVEK
jgi:hypothetical protein